MYSLPLLLVIVCTCVFMLGAAPVATRRPTKKKTSKKRSSRKRDGSHPFNVNDLVTMERISEVAVSPDGQTVAFSLRQTDLDKNRGTLDLWLVNPDGSDCRRLTYTDGNSMAPTWSPDGSMLYFLSSRSGSMQVWSIDPTGGEATQVTNLPMDLEGFKLSPDGRLLAVAIDVFPDAKTLDETKERLDEIEKQKHTGKVYDQLMFRHWDHWKDGRRNHIFVVPVDGSAKPVDVMGRMNADCPSKPFGGVEEYTFTPNSKGIVFSAKDVGRKEAWSTQFDLYLIGVDGKGKPRKLTPGNGAVITNPVFSPDGKTLACLAMARPGYEADRLRIATMNWPNGSLQMLTEHWDRSAYAIVWSADSKTIYTHADHLGQHPAFAVSAKSGRVKQLTDAGKVTSISVCGNELILGLCHHQAPVDLHAMPRTGGERTQITHVNNDRLAKVRMGTSQQFTFKGWNDDTVYGYVVKPVDFDPKKKYPVAFLIHGGPQGSFGNDFHYRWNPQTYTGAGYAVVTIDFHASTGYGQDFTDAINGHWGDRPVEDLQKGLAAALNKFKWLDPKRIGALGASYGGYMVNWIHGTWNTPFKCFICHDGNIDERMAYYDTEELWFPEWENDGVPWKKPDAYTHHNPIDHIDKWCKPTLIIHGGRDYRVVDTQGMSAFTALQRKGVPSRFIYFPDENHWVLKPHNSIQWHNEVIGWLDRWVK
jgi:dipeptidyl aminopeptidase/acylaminoacyl peptidase